MKLENLTLEAFTYGGECFGRLADGRAVFVPHTLPGEQVSIRLVEEKRGFVRGELVEILEPSPNRVPPRCPHTFSLTPKPSSNQSGEPESSLLSEAPSGDDTSIDVKEYCGGCHYQHIPYESQLSAKTEILRDQLIRIGKIENPPIQPMVPAESQWHYRNQLRFQLSDEGQLGFPTSKAKKIIPVRECHLPDDIIDQIWPLLDLESIPGLDGLNLMVGANDDVLLTLQSSDPHPIELEVDLPISVVHTGPGGSIILAGDDHLVTEVAGRNFRVSSGSFFRANTPMIAALVAHILANLIIPSQAILIDAYCGVGVFSAFLAPKVDRLIGIEKSSSACEDFAVNLDEFENVELYEAAVRDVLPTLDVKPTILIIDPPRSGVDRHAIDEILAVSPAMIVYISSDPATLSRDARRLITGGYQLQKITPFDLYPQTYHIESISFWTK